MFHFLTHTNDTLSFSLFMSYVLAQWTVKLKIKNICPTLWSRRVFYKKKENSDVDSRNKTAFISWQLFTFTVMSRLFYCRLIFLTYLFLQSHNSSFAKLSQHQKIIRWVAPTYAQNSIANLYDKNNFSRNIRDITSPPKFNYHCNSRI